jgi:CRP/FNR family transcriptional regulator
MSATAQASNYPARSGLANCPRAAALAQRGIGDNAFHDRIAETFDLLTKTMDPVRRVVRAGERIYRNGERFAKLYVLSSGSFTIVNLAADGREQVVALKFRGDWLGFDGIASNQHSCDAIAMDISEVWEVPYDRLLAAWTSEPALISAFHMAMSGEIQRDHDSLMTVCTMPADVRVAHFLKYWSEAMQQRGLRSDQITLSMTRAEIGNYLGLTLESVSRAFSRLAKSRLINFDASDRRAIHLPGLGALAEYVTARLSPAVVSLQ